MGYTIKLTKNLHSEDSLDVIKLDHVNLAEKISAVTSKFIDDIHFKSYYYRILQFPEDLAFSIDFGSHSLFIDIVCDDSEDYENYLKYISKE